MKVGKMLHFESCIVAWGLQIVGMQEARALGVFLRPTQSHVAVAIRLRVVAKNIFELAAGIAIYCCR